VSTLFVAVMAIAAAVAATPAAGAITGAPIQGNGWIAFVTTRDGNSEVYSMSFDGAGQTNLTNDTASDTQPAYSPDGKKIAFTSNRSGDNDIYVMNADGTGVADVTNAPAADGDATWSPDGTKIAFTSNRGGNADVWVMNVDGTGAADLSNDPAADNQPAWSPDGATIAFTSTRDGNKEIYAMSADGSGATNLTSDAAEDSQAAWSPEGARIAFTSSRDGNNEIYVMGSDGSSPVDVTNDPASDTKSSFAPDYGRRIVYQTDRTGDLEVDWTSLSNGSSLQIILHADLTHNAAADSAPSWQPLPPYQPSGSPIQHVVIIYEENHSFDNLFGKLCVLEARCDGTTVGLLPDGSTMPLPPAKDLVAGAGHDYHDQVAAIDGGKMDGWPNVNHCSAADNLQCYQQFRPSSIPTLTSLAENFAFDDRFFALNPVNSWGSHLELVASHLDGFYDADHHQIVHPRPIRGWGCDSGQGAPWWSAALDPAPWSLTAPDCVPAPDGAGPFEASPVPWVPTIFNRLDQAGLSWNLYAPPRGGGYGWSICPTFGECFWGSQRTHWVDPLTFATDAQAGNLPAFSILTPPIEYSGHPNRFMSLADNWVSTNVSAVMNGPDWPTTTIFVAFDDCGCFYDHVPPPQPNMGPRLANLIIGPYVKQAFTDSGISSQASLMAYVERTFGLAPLSPIDAEAYDLSDSFDYSQQPRAPLKLGLIDIPAWKVRYNETHPMDPNTPDD
jgi:hypothetical protein